MDKRSAARYAAYKHGRGAEYDDKSLARDEMIKKSDEPLSKPATAAPEHGHSHLLSAARKAKAAEAKQVTTRETTNRPRPPA
jgi:hypothetical protein